MEINIVEQEVQNMAAGRCHIFFHENAVLDGIFILFIYLPDATPGKELWAEFLNKYPDPIYFSTQDPGYIGNHCKFHGNYGGNKVYKYAR